MNQFIDELLSARFLTRITESNLQALSTEDLAWLAHEAEHHNDVSMGWIADAAAHRHDFAETYRRLWPQHHKARSPRP